MHRHFARTNQQTISQRAGLIRARLPHVRSIGELCCGDCRLQHAFYTERLSPVRFCGLDIDPEVVAFNRRHDVECAAGDVMNPAALRPFLDFDLLFFGPPLSVDCDGHRLLRFDQVTPGYAPFATLLLGELDYKGALVFICPRATNIGDVSALHHTIHALRPQLGLGVIHHSHSTVTGSGAITEPRLKYVELWFSPTFADTWELFSSLPNAESEQG